MTGSDHPKHRYRMSVAYDGTAYSGWQVQPGRKTVQGELERVLQELTGQQVRVHCSGRTDQGVHAREQVAHFDLDGPVVAGKLQVGLNALLEDDIRVSDLRKARPDFHARYSATGKEYRYLIWNGDVVPPPLRWYRTQIRQHLDVKAMNEAARQLVGRHDFAAFSANPNREIGGTVRALRMLNVSRRGPDVTIVARGDGFLYRMVRSLAGFLIRVGTGELEAGAAREILRSAQRTARVPTAAARGLFLWRVTYTRRGHAPRPGS